MAQGEEDYQALLQKARGALPENVGNRERWELPAPDVIPEGRMTIVRNFRDIVNAMRRDESQVAKFLLTQMATAGNQDGDRMVFVGRINADTVRARLDDYVATFVQCSECGSPDTKLVRQDRVQMLQCEACGAHQPVKARKAARKAGGPVVQEGAVVEVTIDRTGRRGEGFGKVADMSVVVPKTSKGQTVKVRITRIQGELAFGEVIT